MKSSVAHLILIASMLTLLKCVLCYNYGRDEDPSVNQRLDRLEDKVEILTNEMDKVLSVISSEISEENQGESAQQPGVTVLEVRREVEGEMIRFTIKYNSGEENATTRWIRVDGGHEEVNGINAAVGNGVYETSALFPLPVTGNSSEEISFYEGKTVWVFLEVSNTFFGMVLNLTDHEAVDRKIPTPQLEIEPAGDFVYNEGEEFFFKIRIPRSRSDEDGPSSEMGKVQIAAVLLDPKTGKVTYKHDSKVFEIDERKQFQNYEEVTARIMGTENGVSGFINLSLRMRIHDTNDVVNIVERGVTVILRPSSQEGPFPVGFLGFVEMPGPYGSDGDEVVCMLGEDCYFGCGAAGSDITDVTVMRIKADGTYQNLDQGGNIAGRKEPYLENKEVTFHFDYVPKEPEKIRCVVKNANGKLISKEATVVVLLPVDIIEEESGIVLINGTEDAESRTFEISCTVTGSPQPNVTFSGYSSSKTELSQEPDEIIERGDNKYTYTMIKTITYDMWFDDRRWFYLSVECTAMRDSPWSYEFYTMYYDSNNSK